MCQLSAPAGATNTEPGQESHLVRKRNPMSKITELASGAITATDHIVIELVEADETPAAVIIRWPAKPTVLHPHRFPTTADTAARLFAAATVRLAQIRRDRRL
jgi:hypothetical protein